ncbi:MAG: tetratricopeptide repeat protein [Gammaproteobacteria bacterium]|nr:tetratricopeptide repeat protein [Gammaproteobacteria bacterium]
MNRWRNLVYAVACTALAACATSSDQGTLAELGQVEADLDEVQLQDGLERAAESYRRYLAETSESARTPEAMRRLADLQIEQEYGVLGGDYVEMAAPESASPRTQASASQSPAAAPATGESELAFEERASQRQQLLSAGTTPSSLPLSDKPIPAGPREAIKTYRNILETYPDYERNDQVLYQMSRAYDEIGQPDEAMAVMNRLVTEYPHSKYVDEVNFRRGEYLFVRKKYVNAESAYGAIIDSGATSSYFELALYKMGWTLYKQYMYEEALHNYIAMLDHRLSTGYDFDQSYDENDEHRLADTFRVISLSFSNLGGPEVVDEYFAERGHRVYADKIYSNLGEFYFAKLRYEDAASIYRSFIKLNQFHKASPHFSMRIVEIYGDAGFPILVVDSKKAFATDYALDSAYWRHFDVEDSPEIVGFLKTNLTDLANHYHALYQNEELMEEKPASFAEASNWYRQFLGSFPEDEESPQINYQLADLLLENDDFGDAAREYERTAYDYAAHEQASAAGYAAIYAHRENLQRATGARTLQVKQDTVASSLRFADTFQDHEQAAVVLGAAADDLYEMKDFNLAIESAEKLISRYPATDVALLRSAWAVVAHSSIDIAEYPKAEYAYTNLLALTPQDDESRTAVVDGLAAAIYKQGEQANLLEDYRAAANHFLRIKDLAPTSNIRSVAEYDAAAALMKLQDWAMASGVLEEFRETHPGHELGADATKQLAYIYREDGQLERSALEHERIAVESDDPELSREALLTAGDLYYEVQVMDDAIRVYEQYVSAYPRPLDIAMETHTRLADIFKAGSDYDRYYKQLHTIIATDRDAGGDRSDRSRFLAANAALVLAEQDYAQFAKLELTQPFEDSLATKQAHMDASIEAFESLVDYEVAAVTAAATYYIAEIYLNFSAALLQSERPGGLSESEKVDYEMVIEEEAFPFEEQAIGVHEQNFGLLAVGVYNPWVQKSLDQLADLMPGRYAKNEISSGYLGSIDTYAYRMPIAPEPGIDGEEGMELLDGAEDADGIEAAAQIGSGTGGLKE